MTDDDTETERNNAEQFSEVLFNLKGEMIKNRWGNLPAKSKTSEKTPQQLKGALFLKLLEAALGGPMVDVGDGRGPKVPVENITTLAAMLADDVDEIFTLMKEKGFVIH